MRLFCFTVGKEERRLVLFWQESAEGRGQTMCASDDTPDSQNEGS